MAAVTGTVVGAKPLANSGDVVVATWAHMTLEDVAPGGAGAEDVNDVGAAFSGYDDYSDRTVQFFGTFTTATVLLEGSLDGGTTWATLTDPQGNALSKVAATMENVQELTPLVRPRLTGANFTTDITVVLYARKAT